MNRLVKISSWALAVSGLLVSLGFVHSEQKKLKCGNVKVIIDIENGHEFVGVEDIMGIIKNSGDTLVGQSVASIDVGQLEKLIENNPSVANAEVFKDIDGAITIKVQQRNPLLRIFPLGSHGFYIDENGALMPLSTKYSARVLVANGHIAGGINTWSGMNIHQILKNDSIARKTLLDDLFILARFINADSFWKSQVQQVYVDENHEIELIPRVGNHRIIIGDISNLEEKFHRLMVFYKEGLSKTGWNEYETISLKYQNQIVCTKITI